MFTRIIHGARVSLGVAFVGSLTAMVIGVAYGAISGYAGGWLDDVMMRFVDLMYGFPTLLFIILMLLIIPPNSSTGLIMVGLFVALGVVSWLNVARLVRGQFLSLREKEFVEAAESIGAKPARIIWRHLPAQMYRPRHNLAYAPNPGPDSARIDPELYRAGRPPPPPTWQSCPD